MVKFLTKNIHVLEKITGSNIGVLLYYGSKTEEKGMG